ncbi:PREDICTED: uncharacterized protein LOC101305366 [Fragaria vesca subsp. vesca]|uniref:uncharacterized protein LOC101305366 n=1 Tax=Fragaria vesca subsp. vesca TaxID=101020 RepID=UPI0002C32B3E|nr:PREDICTED: uncharacterized protein LOC101305366 [Fragaria vesca subsp. vesca]
MAGMEETQDSRGRFTCELFDELSRKWAEEDGEKARRPGPDGLKPGWVMGSYFYSMGANGEMSEGGSKQPVPMFCYLCGKVCDHWPRTCPSKILSESTIISKPPENKMPPPTTSFPCQDSVSCLDGVHSAK